ncbi:hypothetical protein LINPERPRIM_LOCUS3144 [Linum perenne]
MNSIRFFPRLIAKTVLTSRFLVLTSFPLLSILRYRLSTCTVSGNNNETPRYCVSYALCLTIYYCQPSPKILTEALEELDLMDISRSTIKRSTEISSSASITLDELVDDLNKLDWQECRVTSVEAFYSQKRSSAPADISLTQPANSSPQSVSALKKRKTVLVETVCSKDDAAPITELAKLKKQFTAASKKSKTASYVQTESSKDDAAPAIHAATGPTTRKKQYAAPGK